MIPAQEFQGPEKVIPGKTICPGIAIGKAYILHSRVKVSRSKVSKDSVNEEAERYDRAVRRVSENLHKHIRDMHQETFLDAQKMLEFHEMMLNDELFHESVRRRILKDLMNTEWAITEEADYITSRLESSGDSYLQARIEDIWDMVHNILLSLSLSSAEYSAEIKMIGNEHILVSQNLFLSEVMKARRFQAGGLVTKSNAVISHAAILLKSFNIPSLGNVKDLEMNIKNSDEMIVD